AANYSGPVMYMSSWFWDSRINWHPESISWSDPRALLGYIAEGFEGRIGAVTVVDAEGVEWRRTNQWAFPQDKTNGEFQPASTLFTGHSQYNTDWAVDALEPILSGEVGAVPISVLDHAMQARSAPGGGCNLAEAESTLRLEYEDPEQGTEVLWEGFGVAGSENDARNARAAAEAASCHVRLKLDTAKLDCDSESGWCEGSPYLRLSADRGPEGVAASDVPESVRAALALRDFKPTRRNDGRYLGPPAPSEASCFDTPGPAPADPRLYCTRTQSGNWIGFKWYRFIDQPELNQVFASLPSEKRDAAKCFMQARIERLHEAQSNGGLAAQWFDAPQGAEDLPAAKVSIDPALLLTPPQGLEKGFVPISIYERKRTMPENCEVIVGSTTSEPHPLPAGYYEGYAWDGGWYDREICPANSESNGTFSYPGRVYPYAPDNDQTERAGYDIPTRDTISQMLSPAVRCGLPSDPPGI
ncbi:MAG: hypothetical protein VX223_02995, partial [Myxococcota bacterium]|nr:hypothetical protein [Myxococcota bacterium]